MAEKQCAHPSCTCLAEPGKNSVRLNAERQEQATPVVVHIEGAEISVTRSSPQMSPQTAR